MSRFTRNITPLPILPTPGLNHPRLERLRFMTADAGAAGTAGAAAGDTGAAATAVDSAAAATTTTADAGAQAAQGATGAADDNPWSDPDKAKAEIERLRRENASDRTKAKANAAQEARQALAQDIGKALGLVADDTPPDPAALATAAQEARNGERAAKVELAAFKAATRHGGNPLELLDRKSVASKLEALDPTVADFDAQVDAVVKKAITDNPQLLAQAQAPGASSTDHPGGSGELAGIDAQIAAAEKAGDHQRVIALKLAKQAG